VNDLLFQTREKTMYLYNSLKLAQIALNT